MGLLLNAAPSGAEHIRRLRGVDAGQISGPVLKGARPKPGRRLTDTTETTAQVGRVASRSGGGACGTARRFRSSCCAGNESPGGGDSWSCFGCWLLQQCRAFATSGRWTAAQDLSVLQVLPGSLTHGAASHHGGASLCGNERGGNLLRCLAHATSSCPTFPAHRPLPLPCRACTMVSPSSKWPDETPVEGAWSGDTVCN